MKKEDLYYPDSPYLCVIGANISEVTNFAWGLTQDDKHQVVIRFLRGRKMANLNSLFDEFAAALQFPYYFGENWNAFDECIKDLAWLPGDAYVLIITDSRMLLSDESDEQLDALIDILQSAGNEWSQQVEPSEPWGHLAVPFHVIFQCEESDKQDLMFRLKSVDAQIQEIPLRET